MTAVVGANEWPVLISHVLQPYAADRIGWLTETPVFAISSLLSSDYRSQSRRLLLLYIFLAFFHSLF